MKSIYDIPDEVLADRILEVVMHPPERIVEDSLGDRKLEPEVLKEANKGAVTVHYRILSHLSGNTLNPFRKIKLQEILDLPSDKLAERTRRVIKRIPSRIEYHQEAASAQHTIGERAFHEGAEIAYFRLLEQLTGDDLSNEEEYLLWDLES